MICLVGLISGIIVLWFFVILVVKLWIRLGWESSRFLMCWVILLVIVRESRILVMVGFGKSNSGFYVEMVE